MLVVIAHVAVSPAQAPRQHMPAHVPAAVTAIPSWHAELPVHATVHVAARHSIACVPVAVWCWHALSPVHVTSQLAAVPQSTP